jgi:hypothetical protein
MEGEFPEMLPCRCGGMPVRKQTVIAPEIFIECSRCHAQVFADNDLAVFEKWNERAAHNT